MQTGTPISTPAETVPAGKGILINRNFALLAGGQVISNLGDFVYSTTLLIWVYTLTHSAAAIGGVWIAQYLPTFLFGPIAGVFVDRWDRRYTMVITDIARMLVAVLPLIVPDFLRLPTIYASVFLIWSLGLFFTPAKSGLLQVIVGGKQQPQAASVSQASSALSFIIGPALAAPLYFIAGPTIAILVNAVSYLVSALCIQCIRASKEELHPYAFKEVDRTIQSIGAVVRELLAGLKFVVTTRVLLMITFIGLIGMLGAGALNALDLIFVSKNLHASPTLYGPLISAIGAGGLVGAIIAGILTKWLKSEHILAGGVILLGIGIIVYSFQTWYLVALIVAFIISIPQGGIDVGFGPLMINNTPPDMMGRVQSVIQTSMSATSLLSIGLAAYLGQFIPVNIIFAVCGVLFVLAGLFGWFALTGKKA